jgi:DNA polymerase-1
MKTLYLIDASGYVYRNYFAIRNMTNSKGESTNALFGFIRSVVKLMKDVQPDHLAAVFDGPRNAKKRLELYPQYKAHRLAMPPDLNYQIHWAHQFCNLIGIPMLNVPEAEADDVMGSIAKWAAEQGAMVYLCTGDKDMCQLVNDKIFILNTNKNNQLVDAAEVKKMHGVTPAQMVDFLAMVGDSSDNVPGMAGFGAKTAADLLNSFGSLDYILSHPNEIPGQKKQEILKQEADKALLSRQLVTIDTDVDFPKDSHFFQLKNMDRLGLKEFYASMNFNSLIRELESTPSTSAPEIKAEENHEYVLVDDENSFEELLDFLSKQKEVCFDTETDNIRPQSAKLVGIGFGVSPGKAWYIPTNGKLGLDRVIEGLKKLMEHKSVSFYGHNIKYDHHVLTNYGIKIQNFCFDTILASYILNAGQRSHSLDNLALEYFGKVKIPIGDLIGKGKKQISMVEVPIENVCIYCCEDVDYTCRLKEILEKQLEERQLDKLLHSLELPLMQVLAKMERRGIYLDVPFLHHMSVEVKQEIQRLEQIIFSMAGEEFNLNSPIQLKKILFEKLQIPYPRKRAKDFSTGEEILELLVGQYPIAGAILDYRRLEKLRSTYIDCLPEEVNPRTHRIHCNFNQSVAATGRLSSQEPNLQNIPVRSEVGRKIREAFRPEKEGWSYLGADYSQIELRLLAHFSEDPELLAAFKNNEDIHTLTAAKIYNIAESQVTKEQRSAMKAVNYGILYGQQAFGLSQGLSISAAEAAQFIEAYFKKFKKVKEFIEECKAKARHTGKAVTYTGRERLLPEINSKNGMLRAQAERLAINTPIQGTAADLIKDAMLRIDYLLEKQKKLGYLILQIHDELIFEVPDFELLDFQPLVKEAMEKGFILKVPLVVDIAVGKNWKEC